MESVSTQIRVEDRRRVDELGSLLGLAGMEIGQGQRVTGVEPGQGS